MSAPCPRTALRAIPASALSFPALLTAAATSVPLDLPAAVALPAHIDVDLSDPTVAFYQEWCGAFAELRRMDSCLEAIGLPLGDIGNDEVRDPYWNRIEAARDGLIATPPTTWLGLILKLRVARWIMKDSPFDEPGTEGEMEDDLWLSAAGDAERIMGRSQA